MVCVDETSFKILDCLASGLGSSPSINGLTSRIRGQYGSAHYKNIYDKTQELGKEGKLILTEAGKASLIELNLQDSRLIDLLTEIELEKKNIFLEKRHEFREFFNDLQFYFRRGHYFLESISITNPEKGGKLRRFELLLLLSGPRAESQAAFNNELSGIHSTMMMLEKKHNLKIDFLALNESEFLELLESGEPNPLNEMLHDKITIVFPQGFWAQMSIAQAKGITAKSGKEFNPAKIGEEDLVFNLQRFGYPEMGSKPSAKGENICPEYILTAILLNGNQRRIEAIPAILQKQEDFGNRRKPNYNLLFFLCKKFNKLEMLAGILDAMNRLQPSQKAIESTIKLLKQHEIKTKKMNLESIKQKMRLYRWTDSSKNNSGLHETEF